MQIQIQITKNNKLLFCGCLHFLRLDNYYIIECLELNNINVTAPRVHTLFNSLVGSIFCHNSFD